MRGREAAQTQGRDRETQFCLSPPLSPRGAEVLSLWPRSGLLVILVVVPGVLIAVVAVVLQREEGGSETTFLVESQALLDFNPCSQRLGSKTWLSSRAAESSEVGSSDSAVHSLARRKCDAQGSPSSLAVLRYSPSFPVEIPECLDPMGYVVHPQLEAHRPRTGIDYPAASYLPQPLCSSHNRVPVKEPGDVLKDEAIDLEEVFKGWNYISCVGSS